MPRILTPLSLGIVCLAAVASLRCGGDSSPAGPSAPAIAEKDVAVDDDSAGPFDTSAIAEVAERLLRATPSASMEVSDVTAFDAMDWALSILRAPKNNSTLKVNQYGMFPKPPPRFKFKATAAVDIPEAVFLVIFLTGSNRECGFALVERPFRMTANVPKTLDIANDGILVGPEACFLDGQNCTRTQCKFPLTTTRMRILFGNDDQGVGESKTTVKYKWTR
jgi:hypothetical protein